MYHVLFKPIRFIIPKNQIPDYWIWFYYISPMAYTFKAVMINEFSANDYDFDQCLHYNIIDGVEVCVSSQRFGDFVLDQRGMFIFIIIAYCHHLHFHHYHYHHYYHHYYHHK